MASQYIIELGINDDITSVIRKVNANFRNLNIRIRQNKNASDNSSSPSSPSIDEAVSNALGEINSAVTNGIQSINSAVDSAIDNGIERIDRELNLAKDNYSEALRDTFNDLLLQASEITVPPVGTIIICEYDPNTQWPGSTWEQIEIENIEMILWRRTS